MTQVVVIVVCNNPAHGSKTVKLLTFRGLPAEDGEIRWVVMRNRSRSQKPGRNQSSRRDDWGLSNEAVMLFKQNPPVLPEDYNKVVFKCPLCSVQFSTSDGARMDSILTKFHRHAITEISLMSLRAAYSR